MKIIISPRPRSWQDTESNLSLMRTSIGLLVKTCNLDRMQTYMAPVFRKRVKRKALLGTQN